MSLLVIIFPWGISTINRTVYFSFCHHIYCVWVCEIYNRHDLVHQAYHELFAHFFYLCKHERKINTFYGGNILFLKINNCSILSFFNYISFIFQLLVGSQYWRLQDSNSLFMRVQNMNLKKFHIIPISSRYHEL